MERVKNFIQNHWYGICIAIIILLAMALRFYDYENRWGLAYDQAHSAVVARFALESFKIPLVGPFSSAGPFQTGGEWYWFIMAATSLYPKSVLTPWVALTLVYVAFVFLMILLGKELLGKQFGILAGFLSAVSTAQIAQSTNLTNQSPLAILVLFAIWSMVRYIKRRSSKYLFFLGFSVSLASTIHLQGAALLLLVITTLLFSGIPSVRGLVALLLGLVSPLLPLIIFDFQNNFVNIRGIWQYYLYEQYKISFDVLGRRWLTYAGVFWPNAWTHIIGGQIFLGYLVISGLILATVHNFFKKAIPREWWVIIISFLLMLTLIRYTRTPLFDSYLVFLHPFVLLLTAWLIFTLLRKKVIFGLLVFVLILAGSLGKDIEEIRKGENFTAFLVRVWMEEILQEYPGSKFAVYDLQYSQVQKSLPLTLFLETAKKIDDQGLKIGLTIATSGSQLRHPVILGERGGYQFFNLESSTSAQLAAEGWALVNPSEIYRSTEEWYQKEKIKR